MTDSPPVKDGSSSHTTVLRCIVWLVAALAVYLLSMPPVYMIATTKWGTVKPQKAPAWAGACWQSWQWIYDHTVLKEPMHAYATWWRVLFLRKVQEKEQVALRKLREEKMQKARAASASAAGGGSEN